MNGTFNIDNSLLSSTVTVTENKAENEAKNMASHLISNFDPSQRVDILESMREIIYNNLKEVVADKRSVLEDYEQNLKRLEEGI